MAYASPAVVYLNGARYEMNPRTAMKIKAALLTTHVEVKLTWPERPEAETLQVAANIIAAYIKELNR
jgi:hypothetical protein